MKPHPLVGVFTVAATLCLSQPARADSPITSTPFHQAYGDIEMVDQAARTGQLDLGMAEWLSSDQVPLDQKAALVNALSWDVNGKANAQRYRSYLTLKYGGDVIDPQVLTAAELMVLGYLTVMDNYFEPERGIAYLNAAQEREPQSYTVAIVRGLILAQMQFGQDWCALWGSVADVELNRSLQRDLRPQARQIIFDYMHLYRKYC